MRSFLERSAATLALTEAKGKGVFDTLFWLVTLTKGRDPGVSTEGYLESIGLLRVAIPAFR
jgi:hypothetical protein